MAPPRVAGAADRQQGSQAASGGRAGVCAATFGSIALKLFDNGYLPLPLIPGKKYPLLPGWTTIPITGATVEQWVGQYPHYGIGLRTGTLVGIDIDVLDPDLAHQVDQLVRLRLGDTPTRVGLWPKRLLPFRTEAPIAKILCGEVLGAKVEFLGLGQQFVAYGIHPDTLQPYRWVDDSPLDVPFDALPLVDPGRLETLKVEIDALLPRGPRGPAATRKPAQGEAATGLVRDEQGRVVDGRDGWLSTIAYHAVHDAVAAGADRPDPGHLAAAVWERFAATADLDRPASHGRPYTRGDAERKVVDKLRLLAQGRLPPRALPAVEIDYRVPDLTAEAAREQLEVLLGTACARIAAWYADPDEPCPRVGIKATVGLGKSTAARHHLLALRERLKATGAPSRLLVLVPSHALADEAAAQWRGDGASVAVLRGYEAIDPRTGVPMCTDLAAVRAAVDARLQVHETACAAGGHRCDFFGSCPKQRNRAEVAAADVIVAAHHALFTGFAVEAGSIAAIVIDEGHWSSAIREDKGIDVQGFAKELLNHSLGRGSDDAIADLHDLRSRAVEAFAECGPIARSRLLAVGLDEASCRLAATLEERRLRRPELHPGMPSDERRQAIAQARVNARTHMFIELWQAMAELVAASAEHNGAIFVQQTAKGGREVSTTGLRPIHPTLRDKPVLYLDATVRPALVERVLPGIELHEIDAAAPSMTVRLVVGRFGKTRLCPQPRLVPAEAQRRANRLREVVDYVAWQARRVAPGRMLVVTYKACEAAFERIAGVETAHFNAVAGLDAYRDVRLLVVVGRPLPSDAALAPLAGALFRHLPAGGYGSALRGVRMRDGSNRAVRVRAHRDEKAELLRAAICDDEVLQAIGRGRGVNRSPDNPLEVHVLADVALPLMHDQLLAWDAVVPDLLQRMLLDGVAVDSPKDAALLHPTLFSCAAQAEAAFGRAGFNRQNPIRNLYREMPVKSAAYRRPGRGRSWQRAWWIDGDASATEATLSAALGPLAEFRPS